MFPVTMTVELYPADSHHGAFYNTNSSGKEEGILEESEFFCAVHADHQALHDMAPELEQLLISSEPPCGSLSLRTAPTNFSS